MYLSAFVVAMSTWGAISSVRPLPFLAVGAKESCLRGRVVYLVVVGFMIIVILVSRVQTSLLVADIVAALASKDADRVSFQVRLKSFRVLLLKLVA